MKRRIALLIAYLTTDEVNQDLAIRMADECGAAAVVLSPRDPLPDGQFEAAVYDLDYVPPALRDEILTKLLCGPRLFPVAVHSYNLLDGQIEALCQKNVSVYRRLNRAVFLNLALAWRLSQLPAAQVEEHVHRNGQQGSDRPADGPTPWTPIRTTKKPCRLPDPQAFPP